MFYLVKKDITGRKKAEASLQKLNEELEQRVKERTAKVVKSAELIKKANRVYAVLSNINQMIVRVKDRQKLFDETCRIAVEDGKFRMAWIGMVDKQTNIVKPVASNGITEDYLRIINIDLKDEILGNGPTGRAIKTGDHFVANDIANNAEMIQWRKKALSIGYQSSAAFPIKLSGNIIGSLILYAEEQFFFDEEEVKLLDEIAMDISYAIESIENERTRKIAEERLKLTEKRFRSLIEQGNDIIALIDEVGIIKYVSPSSKIILGYTDDEFLGTDAFRLVHKDDLANIRQQFEDVIVSPGKMVTTEMRYLHKNGSYIWVEISAVNQFEDSNIGALVTTARDITERKQSEKFTISQRNLGLQLGAISSMEDLFKVSIEALMSATGMECSAVYLFDEEFKNLELVYSEGLSEQFILDSSHYDENTENVQLIKKGKPHFTNFKELLISKNDIKLQEKLESVCIIPMINKGKSIGSIHLASHNIVEMNRTFQNGVEIMVEFVTNALIRIEMQNEILDVNASLEIKIENRTEQLAEKNKELQIRHAELQTQNEQLIQIQKRLDETRKKYFDLYNFAPFGYLSISEDGIIIEANLQAANLFGIEVNQLPNRSFTEYVFKKDKDIYYLHKNQLHQTCAKQAFEIRIKRENGQVFWANIELTLSHGLDNKSNYGLTINDITERKNSEQEVNKLQQQIDYIFGATKTGLSIVDADYNLQHVSKSIQEVYGNYTGRKCYEYFKGAKELCPECLIPKSFETGTSQIYETTYPFENNRSVQSTTIPFKDENGKWFAAEVTVDIMERKKFEAEIKKAKDEAEKANIAKSEFLSRMSHELRTPLNSILGFSQLMDMGELAPNHRKGVSQIMKSGKHLLELINEVLDLSRIEAGKLSVSLEPIQLNGIIKETIDVIKPLAADRNIALDFPDSPVCNLFVKADKQKLRQVLLNLINNAVKYNYIGGSVRLECEEAKDSSVKINVVDTGKGIAEEEIEKLFTPFQRIGSEISEVEGTGLGLAVAKKLIEVMNGTIGVESKIGVGSTFWIKLPKTESQADRLEHLGDLIKQGAGKSLASGTILYVEDNISNIQLVEQIIETHRPAIRLIREIYGKNAVKQAIDYKPNLILLDLDLPDVHGSEVLMQLQKNENTKFIPVVILSADATPSNIDRLLKAGANNFITKPLDVVGLLGVLDEYLS